MQIGNCNKREFYRRNTQINNNNNIIPNWDTYRPRHYDDDEMEERDECNLKLEKVSAKKCKAMPWAKRFVRVRLNA